MRDRVNVKKKEKKHSRQNMRATPASLMEHLSLGTDKSRPEATAGEKGQK